MLTTPAPSSGDDIPIDVDLIKVLASDTRRDVLRLLGERRHTLSELAEALNLKKATILEHLEKLTAAELVRRIDDGERIWIYYELTRRGNRLVHPERTTRFYLIMASSVVALVVLGGIVAATMLGNLGEVASSPEMSADDAALTDELSVSTPLVVYRGFDDNVPIVLESAAPPGSTLLLNGRELPISGDRAVLTADDVDALPEGRYRLALRTDAGELPLRSELDVRTPPVALAPLAIPEDETTQLVLSVGAPGLPTPTDLTVLVEGKRVELSPAGHDNVFSLTPTDADVLDVRIGRLIQRDVRVIPELRVAASDDNGTLVLVVSDADGPLAGVDVALGADALGVTDANGTLRTAWPAEGERALTLEAADGRIVERAYAVRERTFLPAPARFELHAYSDPGAQTLAALVDVTNLGPANDTVTLVARLDGTPIASARVDVAPGARSEARLVANVPLTAPVTIEAYGARAAATSVWSYWSGDADAAGATAAAPPAAMTTTGAESQDNVSGRAMMTEAATAKSTLAGRSPDATFTLFPTVAPTAAGVPSAPAAEPAVPGPGALLVLVAIAAAALVAARRRAP